MEQFPEFVTTQDEERSPPGAVVGKLTGWERVVFQVEDEPESALSTAAAAP